MQPPDLIRLGTRKSALALAQAELVRQKLAAAFPDLRIQIIPLVTSGDRSTALSLADIGGKGLFTRELEEALLQGTIDIAVHSLKDMESWLPEGLFIAATLERAAPQDALVTCASVTLSQLISGARVGTSSPRRAAQLKILRPDLNVMPFRGNVPTRLAKLKEAQVDATLLALAGLARLGREKEVSEIFDPEHFIPAAGQGTIAIECRLKDEHIIQALKQIDHTPTHIANTAERSVLAALGGSCRTPIGSYAFFENDRLHLHTIFAKPDGSRHVKATRIGVASDAELMGKDAAKELLAGGGKDWLCA